MNNGTFPTNVQVPLTEPQLSDLLDLWKKDTFLSLMCHGVATITAFDPTTQTATATMNYAKTFLVKQADGSYAGQLRPYPPLSGCPVIFLGGVESYLTFPDVVGVECQVLFNDRDLDNWFTNNGQSLSSSRLHSFSDATLLVGMRSKKNVIANFDTDRILLKKGNAVVGVGMNNELVKIANELYTLNGLLQQLITAVQGITVGPGTFSNSGGSVAGSSGKPLNSTAFTTIANKLNNLLE